MYIFRINLRHLIHSSNNIVTYHLFSLKPKKEKKKKKKSKDPNKPAKARSLVRLGSPEKAYDMDPVLQIGMIGGVEHPSDHTATKITCSVLGIATIAVVGLYLYKKRHTGKTKNTETEHSDSVSDPMEDVA